MTSSLGDTPKEWWNCPASPYNAMTPADCGHSGLCGTSQCHYRLTSQPPVDWRVVLLGDKYVGVDIEIAALVPEKGSWDDFRPLGITCAATIVSDGEQRVWHGTPTHTGLCPPRMVPEECRALVAYLSQMKQAGYPSLTWNGAGFDFRTLWEECENNDENDPLWHSLIVSIAMAHFDPGWQMLTEKGFMVGLQKASESLGVVGKMVGMSGDKAPAMWKESRDAQKTVLAYVVQDVQATNASWEALRKSGQLDWISGSGRENTWRPHTITPRDGGGASRMLTVDEAWRRPYPDISWMSTPRRRGAALEWTGWVQVPPVTKSMRRKGIAWRDVDKKVKIDPYTRGMIVGQQGDNYEVCFVELLDQTLIVSPQVIDLA